MATRNKNARGNGERRSKGGAKRGAASVQLARRGVSSSEDFRNLMVGMMTDVIQGKITPNVVNAACNAGRGLLKMVEMEYRASMPRGGGGKTLPISRRIGTVASA